jgi:hypothetical protein
MRGATTTLLRTAANERGSGPRIYGLAATKPSACECRSNHEGNERRDPHGGGADMSAARTITKLLAVRLNGAFAAQMTLLRRERRPCCRPSRSNEKSGSVTWRRCELQHVTGLARSSSIRRSLLESCRATAVTAVVTSHKVAIGRCSSSSWTARMSDQRPAIVVLIPLAR